MKIATQLIMSQLGGGNSNISEDVVSAALSKLMLTNSSSDLKMGGLLGQLNGGGLASMAASWLGDGGDSPMDAKKITDFFGHRRCKLCSRTGC
jgi:uncharacterized protein YidB (DUF937 family)